MNGASALATAPVAAPGLAEQAVRTAREKAGLHRVGGILLFLSHHFSRLAQPAVLAAARAGDCLQVFGMTTQGLLTEDGWSLDQPAAAALVIGDGLALGHPVTDHAARLAFTGSPTLPVDWRQTVPRHGLLSTSAPVWQQGRLMDDRRSEATVLGARCHAALSAGLQPLTAPLAIDAVHGYDLTRVDGQSAADSLARALPPGLRARSPLPLHLLCVERAAGGPGIPLLGANADGSLTLAEALAPSEHIVWSARQPLAAERDMADSLEAAARACPTPAFALMLSCIGRGPLFYGNDDRDLLAFRRRFPGLPLLGGYGSGQIHPFAGQCRQYQNSVVTLLFESAHVQSLP